MLSQWWSTLDPMMQVLWAITLTSSLIFLVQSVMTFLGANSDVSLDTDMSGDIDIDMDGSGGFEGHSDMNLLTFRNLINFCMGFGWTSVLLRDDIRSTALLFTIATAVGIALVVAVMYMFKWLSRMQQSGNIDVFKAAKGCQGKVYLTIPGERSGEGKVMITINNSVREYQALTDGPQIKTGTSITVLDAIDAHTVLVEEQTTYIV